VQAFLDERKLRSLLIMQVHDELVFEVPESELDEIKAHVPRLMQSVGKLEVPLEVELGVGDNWDKAHV
jgi:DNA polymerase I